MFVFTSITVGCVTINLDSSTNTETTNNRVITQTPSTISPISPPTTLITPKPDKSYVKDIKLTVERAPIEQKPLDPNMVWASINICLVGGSDSDHLISLYVMYNGQKLDRSALVYSGSNIKQLSYDEDQIPRRSYITIVGVFPDGRYTIWDGYV